MPNPIHYSFACGDYYVWLSRVGVKYMKYFPTPDHALEYVRNNKGICMELVKGEEVSDSWAHEASQSADTIEQESEYSGTDDREMGLEGEGRADFVIHGRERRSGGALRAAKRVGITSLAFLASGILIALWREYMPSTSLSGALMAVAAVALVFGTWSWSSSFK